MEKYLFLDVDGVIATPKTIKDGMWGLTPSKQELLGIILKRTGAKIVLSSSWRLPTVGETKEYMKKEGFWFCEEIIGVTIRAYKYIDKAHKIHLSIPRGVEIKQWLETHVIYPWYSKGDKVYRTESKAEKIFKLGKDFTYVILDDDKDMLLEQKKYFINTHYLNGLSLGNVNKAIKILNNEQNN